jgi:hypothetical protein
MKLTKRGQLRSFAGYPRCSTDFSRGVRTLTARMAKELTKAEYLTAIHTPRRRFKAIALRQARVTLRGHVEAPCYWFERDDVAEGDGTYWRSRPDPTISMVVDGKTSLLLYVAGGRLGSCTFAYHLNAAELEKAVTVMKRMGLQRLIVPAVR